MIKIAFLIITIALLVVFVAVIPATAASLGKYCWQMSPSSDNIELSIIDEGGYYLMAGIMRGSTWSTVVHGAAAVDIVDGGIDFAVSFEDQLDSTYAGHIHSKLDSTLRGPFFFEREDGFTKTGTLVRIACPIPDEATAVFGKQSINQ